MVHHLLISWAMVPVETKPRRYCLLTFSKTIDSIFITGTGTLTGTLPA